jgi:hypothetical protein
MEALENITKNDTHFKDWLSGQPDKDKCLTDNYIDISQSLELKGFEDFLEKRRNKLKTELQKLLK